MSAPDPLAHHSRLWYPQPENSIAIRVGASLDLLSSLESSPQTHLDSIHGSAIDMPIPCKIARRESRFFIWFTSFNPASF
jgi:hypothetical protein